MSGKTLLNKVIMITGGSGGIGGAIVKRVSESGAEVVSVFCKNIPFRQSPENTALFRADLKRPEEWDRLLSFAQKKYGKIDILINCAGCLEPGNFSALNENAISEMIEINFTSVITGIYKTLKIFKEQGSGRIINIGSLGGIVPMPGSSIYSATKFALRGFTFSLAEELKGTGIKINLVSPGPVLTKMLGIEAQNENTAISFVTKPVSPDEVAKAVLKVIRKPRFEVIIPASQSIASRLLILSPYIFSSLYRVFHKIGIWRKSAYQKRYSNLKLSEGS